MYIVVCLWLKLLLFIDLQADFLDRYAFSMQPVLVKDGQSGWTASETFSFDYFKSVYYPGSEV